MLLLLVLLLLLLQRWLRYPETLKPAKNRNGFGHHSQDRTGSAPIFRLLYLTFNKIHYWVFLSLQKQNMLVSCYMDSLLYLFYQDYRRFSNLVNLVRNPLSLCSGTYKSYQQILVCIMKPLYMHQVSFLINRLSTHVPQS